jgi:acetyl esterase
MKAQVNQYMLMFLSSAIFWGGSLHAVEAVDQIITYKHAAGTNLNLLILKPKSNGQLHPGLLFFHGGGWNNGTAEKSIGFLKHFCDAGFVCASVDYRCRDTHGGTTPMDATRDARSALRAFAAHAKELGMDSQKLIVGGGSAGGHLACMTALGDGLGEPDEEKTPAPPVAALLLWNPVVDTTDKGYGGTKRFGDLTEKYSPVHLLRSNSPPVIVEHGDADQTVPYENAQRFIATAKKLGIKCKLVTFPGQKHSFASKPENRDRSYREADDFLKELKLWP